MNLGNILKGALIGGGVGLASGIGLSLVKELKHKQVPASKDLSVQTLNMDRAAPDLVPLFVALEELVDRIAPADQVEWRRLCTKAISSSDRLYNILVMVARKELRPELKHVGEVEIWAQQVVAAVGKLQTLLPEQQPPAGEGQENIFTVYLTLSKEIQENVQNAWLNFKNSV